MLQLASSLLSDPEIATLKKLQDKLDALSLFEKKTKKAQLLWDAKGSPTYKSTFSGIKANLMSLTVYVETCNYCEHNEATDIEHIYPKSFFPEKTFVWDNYLLACKICNTTYKLDQCLVVSGSGQTIRVNRGHQAPFPQLAFINPRIEDPNQFLYMNTLTWKFDLLANLNPVDIAKAKGTIEILQLNTRSLLTKARKDNAVYIFERLDKLQRILAATDFDEIKQIISPYNHLDISKPLAEMKTNLKASFLADIHKKAHPSVWYWIRKISSKTEPKWIEIFAKFPELVLG